MLAQSVAMRSWEDTSKIHDFEQFFRVERHRLSAVSSRCYYYFLNDCFHFWEITKNFMHFQWRWKWVSPTNERFSLLCSFSADSLSLFHSCLLSWWLGTDPKPLEKSLHLSRLLKFPRSLFEPIKSIAIELPLFSLKTFSHHIYCTMKTKIGKFRSKRKQWCRTNCYFGSQLFIEV